MCQMPQGTHSTRWRWWWEDKRGGQGLWTFNTKWSKNSKSDLDFQSWKYINRYRRIEHILFSNSLVLFNLSRDPQPLGSNAWWFGGITDVIIIEIKWTINLMWLNHPETIPATHPWKKCLPINWSLDQKCWGPWFKAMPCGFLLLLLPGPCKFWKWGEYTMHFNQRLVIYCFHDDKDLNLVSSKWPFLCYASIYHSVKEIGMLYTLEQFVTYVNNSWQYQKRGYGF